MELKVIADEFALNQRLDRNTLLFLGLALAASIWFGTSEIVAGVLVGGILALFNKRWLVGSIRSLLAAVTQGQESRQQTWSSSKLILRYLVVAIFFGLALSTGLFHPLGMAIGFASFVGGVMIEAGYQIYLALKTFGNE